MTDNAQKVKIMKNMLISLLNNIDNQYYITNILVEIVTLTFEYTKEQNYEEIKIMSCYPKCIELLQKMLDKKSRFNSGMALIHEYKNVIKKSS